MFDLSPIGAAAFLLTRRDDGNFVYGDFNEVAERLIGWKRAEIVGRTAVELLGADRGASVQDHHRRCAATKGQVEYETPVQGPKGARYFKSTLTPILSPDGSVDTIFGVTSDVTEHHQLQEALHSANLRLNIAMEALGGAHWFYDPARQTFELSPAFETLLGESVPRVMSVDEWQGHVVEEDRNDTCFADLMAGRIEQGTAEFRVKTGNGDTRWLRCRRRSIRDQATVTGIAGVVVDVTNEKRQYAQLNQQAKSDPLTGLANRRRFDEALANIRHGCPVGLLMIDVDHFKAYNDRYGHGAGDIMLKQVADVLDRTAALHGGLAARVGGEEFTILFRDKPARTAIQAAEAILREFSGLALPHESSPRGQLSVSIGIAVCDRFSASEATSLMAAADAALYRAKAAGRACYRSAALEPARDAA